MQGFRCQNPGFRPQNPHLRLHQGGNVSSKTRSFEVEKAEVEVESSQNITKCKIRLNAL